MSISEIVDEKYRLHATDLHGRAQYVTISNVSYQGIEDLNPVLHFTGTTKRSVLNQAQCQNLIQLTGSLIFTDWIGREVLLEPRATEGEAEILIRSQRGGFLRRRLTGRTTNPDLLGWIVAVAVVITLLAISSLYVSTHLDRLWPIISRLLP